MSAPAAPRSHWGGAVAALALAAAAYAPLLGLGPAPPELPDAGQWFFEPEESPTVLVLAVASWLAWRRRGRLRALPAESRPALAATLAIVGVVAYVWAQLSGAFDLLLIALAGQGLALACASKGRAGCRVLCVPVLALLLAIPVPGPLQNELVWALQRWSAAGARGLMELGGLDVGGNGVLLSRGDAGFLVIESCSGLRGIRTLTLIALVVRDLFASSGRRQWLLVALAPGLALGLNVVRVAWIASGEGGGAGSDGHVGQGMTVLLAGTVMLFATGRLLAWNAPARAARAGNAPLEMPWRSLCVGLALLTALSLSISPWPTPRPHRPSLAVLFADRAGWEAEAVEADLMFVGNVRLGQIVQRRFQRAASAGGPAALVELFVGMEQPGAPRRSPFSSKLALPARDWSADAVEPVRDWRLWRDVDVVIASRGDQRALVHTWRLGDRGLAREALRSLLALERGPFARPGLRGVVRLATPLAGNGTRARADAKRVIDRFIVDFGDDLEALGGED
jgi:exosortase